MELIYNITFFLIVLVILLVIVLFISFVLSRLRKEEGEYSGNMIAQRQPKMPRTIQVVPAKPRKIRSQDTQIYYLNKLRDTTNNYRQPVTMGGSGAYYNGGTRLAGTNGVDYVGRNNSNGKNKRYTIVNNQLRGAQGIVRDENKFESNDDQVSFYGR